MTSQPDLFSSTPVVRSQAPCAMRPRLSKQCQVILARLVQGPATNDELSRIARKYTGRLSELRQAGYRVECYEHNHATGVTKYRLGEAK